MIISRCESVEFSLFWVFWKCCMVCLLFSWLVFSCMLLILVWVLVIWVRIDVLWEV